MDEHGDEGAWKQFRFSEDVGVLRKKDVFAETREGFGNRDSQAYVQPLHQNDSRESEAEIRNEIRNALHEIRRFF